MPFLNQDYFSPKTCSIVEESTFVWVETILKHLLGNILPPGFKNFFACKNVSNILSLRSMYPIGSDMITSTFERNNQDFEENKDEQKFFKGQRTCSGTVISSIFPLIT